MRLWWYDGSCVPSRKTNSNHRVLNLLLYALQVKMGVDRLVLHHERPILGVVVLVDDREDGMVHVVLSAPADVLEFEVDRLAVGRTLSGHARTISGVAIMNQRELLPVYIKHRDGMVILAGIEWRTCFLELVHECVSPRSDPHGCVHRLAARHLRHLRDVDRTFPLSCQAFQGCEGLLRVGFWSVGHWCLMLGESDCGE